YLGKACWPEGSVTLVIVSGVYCSPATRRGGSRPTSRSCGPEKQAFGTQRQESDVDFGTCRGCPSTLWQLASGERICAAATREAEELRLFSYFLQREWHSHWRFSSLGTLTQASLNSRRDRRREMLFTGAHSAPLL